MQSIPVATRQIIAQSLDGSVVGVSYLGSSVSFFNTETATQLGTTHIGQQSSYYIGIAPSNDRFVTQLYKNGKYSTPAIFIIATGQLIKPLPAEADVRYHGLEFSAEGKKLVGAYIENNRLKLRMWNF